MLWMVGMRGGMGAAADAGHDPLAVVLQRSGKPLGGELLIHTHCVPFTGAILAMIAG